MGTSDAALSFALREHFTRSAAAFCTDHTMHRQASDTDSSRQFLPPENQSTCEAKASVPSTFGAAYGSEIQRQLRPWAGRRLNLAMLRKHLDAPAPWCRLQVCVINRRLVLRAFTMRNESTPRERLQPEYLQASRIHAALLELAEMLATAEATRLSKSAACVTLSCGDRPCVSRPPLYPGTGNLTTGRCDRRDGSGLNSELRARCVEVREQHRRKREGPPLILSYMSSLDHYDVPWPDYLFAGKPPSGIPSWRVLHADLLQHARRLPYAERFDRCGCHRIRLPSDRHRIATGLPSECHRSAIGVPSDCHLGAQRAERLKSKHL